MIWLSLYVFTVHMSEYKWYIFIAIWYEEKYFINSVQTMDIATIFLRHLGILTCFLVNVEKAYGIAGKNPLFIWLSEIYMLVIDVWTFQTWL